MSAPSGTVWGSVAGVSPHQGKIGIYVSLSSTSTQTTRHTEIWFWSKYSVSDTNNTFYYDDNATSATTSKGAVSINTTVSTGSGWSTSNQVKLAEYDYTFTRGTSASTRSVAAKLTNIDIIGSTMTATATYTIPALASYTVSYNANGGSGAPGSQTKYYGKSLTLSSTKPTRTGYTFKGWGTSSTTTTVSYAAGASYTANAAITLYAVWQANTYTVSYNANGGTGAPSSQTKTYGVALTLSSTKPTRTGYTFKGWATSASGSVSYAAGASYTKNAAVTLYAVWESSYSKPKISSISVYRSDSSGNALASGTYAKVKFKWSTTNSVSSIKIAWKSASSTLTSTSVTASGTSGTVEKVIGSGSLSEETSYTITITVTDSGGSWSANRLLPTTKYIIDILSGGLGISFGKTAELSGYADFGYYALFRKNAYLANGMALYGQDTDGTGHSLIYMNAVNNTVIGYGSYNDAIGSTNLYGNSINIISNNGVKIGGCTVAENSVLWSGALYMKADHTCTLSSAISSQANGIILVWSSYSSGAANDSNFNFTFIPKQFVANGYHSGKGVTSAVGSGYGATYAFKYLYVSDTSITGYANNNASDYTATCGINCSPKSFVLRYVIGV